MRLELAFADGHQPPGHDQHRNAQNQNGIERRRKNSARQPPSVFEFVAQPGSGVTCQKISDSQPKKMCHHKVYLGLAAENAQPGIMRSRQPNCLCQWTTFLAIRSEEHTSEL